MLPLLKIWFALPGKRVVPEAINLFRHKQSQMKSLGKSRLCSRVTSSTMYLKVEMDEPYILGKGLLTPTCNQGTVRMWACLVIQ